MPNFCPKTLTAFSLVASNAGRNQGRGLVNLLREVHAPQEGLEALLGRILLGVLGTNGLGAGLQLFGFLIPTHLSQSESWAIIA